jgi:hypothetical protein
MIFTIFTPFLKLKHLTPSGLPTIKPKPPGSFNVRGPRHAQVNHHVKVSPRDQQYLILLNPT